jgi:hypothetical protein
MKFHTPSFLMGFASATVLAVTSKRLKPIAVELGALGMHLGHLAWGVVERQREYVEDMWAEIENRTRERRQRVPQGQPAPTPQKIHIEPTEARH